MNHIEARLEGERMSTLCADKAERESDFSVSAAAMCILGALRRNGPASGELLTDVAKEHGHVPKDDRAFGAAFGKLSRRKLIRCIGYETRRKGHGTGGARVWEALV